MKKEEELSVDAHVFDDPFWKVIDIFRLQIHQHIDDHSNKSLRVSGIYKSFL